jgi:organic hydroperoxide reductase OsmC/OhrA
METVAVMSEHKAAIKWTHTQGDFLKGSYSREHTWTFDGGVTVPASPAPTSVMPPYSNAANVDPEEAYVAAISSCHMLTFLWVASRKGLEVTSYEDDALGKMTKNERGIPWVSSVVLCPRVAYSGTHPTSEVEEELHRKAHEACYIANSVKTQITVDRQLR